MPPYWPLLELTLRAASGTVTVRDMKSVWLPYLSHTTLLTRVGLVSLAD